MVDEKKVRLMTRLAIYEKHEKNRNLVMSRYYKNDYVRLNVLKTWVATTFVYWLIVVCYVFMKFDELLIKVNDIDYFDVMYKLLGGYVIVCLVYFIIATMIYNYRYISAKRGLVEYNSNLKDLIELEGGPLHRGRLVSKEKTVTEQEEKKLRPREQTATMSDKKTTVNRTEIMRQRLAAEEKKKQEEIKRNVELRNARIAAQNEAALRQQQQMAADRQRIKEKREQLEREQLERLRSEQMKSINRENHTYNRDLEGRDR